jgi:predicted secreted protein
VKKWTSTVSLTVLALLFAASCGADEPRTYTDTDTGAEIELATGDQFELRLPSNPSTGYQWIESPSDIGAFLTLVSQTYQAPETDRVGVAGTEVFRYEATAQGAGILRLEYVRTFEDPVVAERVVEYIIRIDDAPWPPVTTGAPPITSTATVTTTVSTTSTTSTTAEPAVGVSALFDGEGPRAVTVGGFVVVDAGSARLCEVLMESLPPQCGWAWIVVPNIEGLDLEFERAGGVAWTPSPVEIAGFFDGTRFIADGGAPDTAPTERDLALTEAFWRYATTGEGFEQVPFAGEVGVGLGDRIYRTVPAIELTDPRAWVIDEDEFRAYAGPFSALELDAGRTVTTVGAHPRCAGPPVPAPEGLADLRRVSLQTAEATSCLEWWTIDFFVDQNGEVIAVTLDLYGP